MANVKLPEGFSEQEWISLKRDIANYNKRIRRAKQSPDRLHPEYLPSEVKSVDIVKGKSAAELRKYQANLREFRADTMQLVQFNGQIMTLAEKNIIQRNIAAENERRRQVQAVVAKEQEALGRFPSQRTYDLKEIVPDKVTTDMIQQLRQLDYTPVLDKRSDAMQRTYMQTFNAYETLLPLYIDKQDLPEAQGQLQEIKEKIGSLSQEALYLMHLTVPELTITTITDEQQFMRNINTVHKAVMEFTTKYQ